ncbi:MAG: nickel pincer cofactor biosynthesis protein LarC [Chloroflexi bacterium]|nr:MAG: nickel pincer cofactor biosynthesis protein LarC [Chloroflexota bacterium]
MSRLAYLDCFSGISGDMLLGAIIDCGVSVEDLSGELRKLPLNGYTLSAKKATRAGLSATQALVEVAGELAPRMLGEVLEIIDASGLPNNDRETGARIFRRLAEAEARVHGETVETVHLHDVGAIDAIVDVMGTLAGLRLLDVNKVFASPLPAGTGAVNGPHGKLPVPAPATLELLSRAKVPLRSADGAGGELVTPTGAAIVTMIASFGRPPMTIDRVGYGAGSRDIEGRPNVLRIWLGERMAGGARQMVLVETNIDDMTGEMLAYARDKLLEAGAADVWFTPIQMKKGRPGLMLSVICSEAQEEAVAKLLLRETSTLGVRVKRAHRWEAEREVIEFESSLGPAAVKIKRLPGEPPSIGPEYEACKKLAEATGLPLAEVYRIVQGEGETRL